MEDNLQELFEEFLEFRRQKQTLSPLEIIPNIAVNRTISINDVASNQRSDTVTNSVSTIPLDDQVDIHHSHWRKPRGKYFIDDGQYERQQFYCSVSSCPAQYNHDVNTATKEERVTLVARHNHCINDVPPTIKKQRLSKSCKENILSKVSANADISLIQKSIVNTAKDRGETRASELPDIQQARNVVNYHRKYKFADSNVYETLASPEYKSIVKSIQLIPEKKIILIPDRTKSLLLEREKNYLFMDGTFCIYGLTLTTLMVVINDVPIPVAWLLHSQRYTETYLDFLSFVFPSTTPLKFRPNGILGDYEAAIISAVGKLNIPYYGDFFHLMQANRRWFEKHPQEKEYCEEALLWIRGLWESSSRSFQRNKQLFENYWREKCRSFYTYFKHEWFDRNSEDLWASCSRAKDVPSGDGVLEGWHHRLKAIFKSPTYRLDIVIKLLDEENKYWHHTLVTTNLREAWQREVKARKDRFAKRRKERSELVRERVPMVLPPMGNSCVESGPAISPAITNLIAATDVEPSRSELATAGTTFVQVENIIAEPEETSTTKYEYPTEDYIAANSDRCVVCSTRKNRTCSLSMCKKCCMKDERECAGEEHAIPKWHLRHPNGLEMLNRAMRDATTLYIRYHGKSSQSPGTVRPIKPLCWYKENQSFTAWCVKTEQEKRYFVKDISEMRAHFFE